MNEIPIKISTVPSFGVALTTFVVLFIMARYALLWMRRRERKGN